MNLQALLNIKSENALTFKIANVAHKTYPSGKVQLKITTADGDNYYIFQNLVEECLEENADGSLSLKAGANVADGGAIFPSRGNNGTVGW